MPFKQLSLASFEDFAERKLSGPIAIFQDPNQYTFETKEPVNCHPVQPAKMLLVGRYHTQHAAFPNVWAHTVGAGITYYLSLPGTSRSKLAPNLARIYFTDEPFSLMVGGEDEEVLYTAHHAQRAYIPGINKWRGVIEAAITFVFLKTGHLDYANVADANGMLSNFRLACMNFARNTSTPCDGRGVKQEVRSDTDSSSSKSSGSARVKVEPEDSGDEWNVDEVAGSAHYSSKSRFHTRQTRHPTIQSTGSTSPSTPQTRHRTSTLKHQKHKPHLERPRLRPNTRQCTEQRKGKSVYTPCCGLATAMDELMKECRMLEKENATMHRRYKNVVRMLGRGGEEPLGGDDGDEVVGNEDEDMNSDDEDMISDYEDTNSDDESTNSDDDDTNSDDDDTNSDDDNDEDI